MSNDPGIPLGLNPTRSADAEVRPAQGEQTWVEVLRAHQLGDLFALPSDPASDHPFNQLHWNPSLADQEAAWEFYTELLTRVATQPLAFRAGDEGAALESLYRLFGLARRAIKMRRGATHFATLVVALLNRRVRPFTARWHRRKVDGQLDSTDVRFSFRRDLAALQADLRRFTVLLASLAEGKDTVSGERAHLAATPWAAPDLARFTSLSFGIGRGTPGIRNYPEINAAEAADVALRRQFYRLETVEQSGHDAVGLAISGGGIRSATFALGIVGVLARRGLLRQVDFLSTVSGGGYLGAFLTSILAEPDLPNVTLTPGLGTLPFADQGESGPVRHLRNHGKYLNEGGLRTVATIVALAAYGIWVSLLLVLPWLLLAVLGLKVFWPVGFQNPPAGVSPGPVLFGLLGLLFVAVILLPLVQNFVRGLGEQPWGRRLGRAWERVCVVLAAGVVAVLAADLIPAAFVRVQTHGGTALALTLAAALPFVLGTLGLLVGTNRNLGRALLAVLVICGPLLAVAAFLFLWELSSTLPVANGTLLTATLMALLYAGVGINLNFASPHRFYRNRLARTYLTRVVADEGGEVLHRDPQPLSTLNPAAKAPYHLLNAALNIPACTNPDLRGRDTDFFLFSKHFCGSPLVGYQPTSKWESVDPHLDLGTAIAISGAAAAPRMGTLTDARLTGLLALLNVRLGYWLRVPGRGWLPPAVQRWLPPLGWWCFGRELTGRMNEKSAYLNVSDGGHVENLGIYELLRRRCKFIIAVDGEADPARSFGGLLTLTQYAGTDLGVRIAPDLADLRLDRDGFGKAHFALADIHYPDGGRGLLLYLKSSLTGNESEFLKRYRAENPDFPHQSTAQQLFGESQFEAYRALGEHIAEELFRSDLVGQDCPAGLDLTVREWFQRLAGSLLE